MSLLCFTTWIIVFSKISVTHAADNTGWTAVTRDVAIPFDLNQTTSLQVKTHNKAGMDDDLTVILFNEQGEKAGGISIIFNSWKYHFHECISNYRKIPVPFPPGQETIWTFIRTAVGVRILCDGREVIHFVVSAEGCNLISNRDQNGWEIYWNRDIAKIMFESYDTASEYYRAYVVVPEYEVLVVDRPEGSTSLTEQYLGVYLPRDELCCGRRAYLHETTKALLYYVRGRWCLTSARYNSITSCTVGYGFYYTAENSCTDVLSSCDWNPDGSVLVREGCRLGTVLHVPPDVAEISSTVVGGTVQVSLLCQSGNVFQPQLMENDYNGFSFCWNKTSDPLGNKYRGNVTETVSGNRCQLWTSQSPNGHTRTPENYPGTGLGEHNYCRNPDNESGGPWCFNSHDTETQWEYCSIPECV